MKKEFAIFLGFILVAGCAHEDQLGAEEGVEMQEQSFAEVDTDANGLISEEEAAMHESLADNFDQADVNSSGYISRSEFEDELGSPALQE